MIKIKMHPQPQEDTWHMRELGGDYGGGYLEWLVPGLKWTVHHPPKMDGVKKKLIPRWIDGIWYWIVDDGNYAQRRLPEPEGITLSTPPTEFGLNRCGSD